MVDTLAANLTLSDSVKSKVNRVYFASFTELKKELGGNRDDFRAMRNIRREITEKREKDTMALLNDKQKKSFTKIIEKRHNQMRKRMKERRRQF